MEFFTIRNWSKFQHYKERNPPWIRLYYDLLASLDWAMASDADKLLIVVCLLVGSRNNGRVPSSPAYVKRIGCLTHTPNFKYLIECGFLEKTLAPRVQGASELPTSASEMLALASRATEADTDTDSPSDASLRSASVTPRGVNGEDGEDADLLGSAEPEPKGKTKTSTPRGTRWPEGKPVPDEWREKARRLIQNKGLTPIDVDLEALKFVNWALSTSGRNGCKLNWERTWANWILEACRRAPKPR